jgi:O-antigen ligase
MKSRATVSAKRELSSTSTHTGYSESVLANVNGLAMFALLVFVLLSPLIVSNPSQTDGATGEGNVFRQLVYIAIFTMALFSSQVVRFPAALLTPPKTMLLMLGWCCLSILWAVNPGVGTRRLFLTLIIVSSIFLLVEKAGYEKTVRSVRWVLPLILAANYLAVLAFPSWGIHQLTEEDPSIVGAWHGVLMQKNFAGAVCALTVLFFVFDAGKISWPVRLTVLAASAVFLYQSNSKTSMALLASSFVVAGLYRLYNPYYRWAACLFMALAALLASVLAYEYWDWITEPFSRQDTLTGRVQIWPVLVRYWQDHWLLGSGFGSFWNVGEPKPISLYSRGWVATQINSGHNGFLDLLVQTGLPGLVLAIFATFLAPLSKFVLHSSFVRPRASLLLACIWFCVLHNLTESSLFDRDAIVHVFLMLAIALLGLEARRQ